MRYLYSFYLVFACGKIEVEKKEGIGMEFNQQMAQQQKQMFVPNLAQGMEMLQLNRMELDAYLNSVLLGNPFIEMSVNEPLTISAKDISKSDVSAVIEQTSVYEASLYEFLQEQIYLLYRDTPLRQLIFWWLEQLDPRGYVTKTLEEAQAETGASAVAVLDGLTLLQQLDPPGIGARSIQECLMLQTERMAYAPDLAYVVLEEHYDDLIHKNWQKIAAAYETTPDQIAEIYHFVQRLTPAPAEAYEARTKTVPYIVPELMVTLEDGDLSIRETKYKTPLLTLNTAYFEEMKAVDDPEVKAYVSAKKQEFDQLQASLVKRKETVLKVGSAILSYQHAFFTNEDSPLKPLQLKDVAAMCQLSESTISRTVRETFVQTPKGIFELKAFLSRRMQNGEQSRDDVLNILQDLIAGEDAHKPYSDQTLVDLLAEKEIEVSRRAIAKYRQQLNIPSSTNRKIK